MTLSSAPLQGFTEYPFRNALHKIIGGIDKFYAPYMRFENDGSLKNKYLKDIHPKQNSEIPLVPQILVNQPSDFLMLCSIIEDFGYTEVNWNLGCPYPMVAKRKLGSGLIPYPILIKQLLEEVIPKTKLNISIKIRAGYESPFEIHEVINQINDLPIHEIILHPRIGKQLYKGLAQPNIFEEIHLLSKIPLAYNGDILDTETYKALQLRFPSTTHWMIGRGLLSNPFLGCEIKSEKRLDTELKRQKLKEFHQLLMEHYLFELSGEAYVFQKMLSIWSYFSGMYTNDKKTFKALKKSRNLNEFIRKINDILRDEPLKQTS